MELAALAGRPGAARAAGRAVSSSVATSLPWHRVVRADGLPHAERATQQMQRLRREGSRPRARESVASWARRVGAIWIGNYVGRRFALADEQCVETWPVGSVERIPDEATALARGFTHADALAEPGVPLPPRRPAPGTPSPRTIKERVDALDWSELRESLRSRGSVDIRGLLTPNETGAILSASAEPSRFDRSVNMLPKGYGVGRYHYYTEPLPEPARTLRERLYRELVPLAVELWPKQPFPGTLSAFWTRCRAAGQGRASSILIGYGKGGINHVHRDVYGPAWFPFQALIMLSKRGRDFDGGHFYVLDDGDRAKPIEYAVDEGDVVIFSTRERFEGGKRIPLRHGMTMVTAGTRYGLGMVFHLAE